MGSVGSGLELGVSLGGYEEGMLGKLAHFHDTSVRGQTGQTKTVFGEDGAIIVVDLITMTMSLGDILLSVELISTGIHKGMHPVLRYRRYPQHRSGPASERSQDVWC